ncbi:MAG: hypothetical protein AB2L14_10490 [Candidatus Xenobiia bacterium LiM19]
MIGPVEEKEEFVERLVHRLILDAHTDKASDIHMETHEKRGHEAQISLRWGTAGHHHSQFPYCRRHTWLYKKEGGVLCKTHLSTLKEAGSPLRQEKLRKASPYR